MQEEKMSEVESRNPSRLWVVILGLIAVGALLCLTIGAVILFISPTPTLPTVVPQAQILSTPLRLTEEAEAAPPPVTQAPLVPQSGGRSAGDPYIPELGNTGYDVQRYTIQLALDPAVIHVEGATTIEATSTLLGLSQLSLDFVGFEVGSVTVNDMAAPFSRDGKKLIIDLPGPQPVDAPFTVVVTYRGQPLSEPSPYLRFVEHLGVYYPDDSSLFTIAEPDGARYWFPANDHPRDKATFRFEVVVPAGMTAVANGRLISRTSGVLPGGEPGELFTWEHDRPMAPYLALVAVGLYERIGGQSNDGIPLRHYIFSELREEFVDAADEAAAAIDWMSDLLGPYPFEEFGYVTARVPGGSMETQSMILLSDAMIGKRTAVHELAHMWFGDWVSLDSWAEMWRNEGFATYMQMMWATRDDPEELELQMVSLASVVEGNDKNYPLNNPPPEYLFELNVYFQGAVVVHALRQEMGDEAFFRGLRTYFERYGGGTASDAQFQAVMEETAGTSLAPFFAHWFPGS